MDSIIFENNLRVFVNIDKTLYNRLNDYSPEKRQYHLEKAQNDSWTMKVKDDTKRYRYLHSSYNPEREAERWVRKQDLAGKKQLFILGLGLGYHLQKLLAKKDSGTRVYVFEPDLDMLYYTLNIYDYSNYLINNELIFVIGTNISLIHSVLENINLISINKINLIETPVCKLYSQEEFLEIIRIINDYFISKHGAMNTIIQFKEDWLNNFKQNLSYLLKDPGIDLLHKKFQDLPAIIVSAGPSLDKNIHLLKEVKGKAVIIAVDTALRAVLETGVIPDIVISVDGKEANWKHYEGIRYDDVVLISDMVSHYKIFQHHSGPKFIFYSSVYQLSESVLEGLDNRRLACGGSVATSAMELGLYMGCNPVILIGQDLALGKDGETHAKGTIFGKDKIDDKIRLKAVKGIDGKFVWTRNDYYIYLKWFEKRIEMLPDSIEIIDATEGGALIEGSKVMTFQEALNKYCIEEVNVMDELISIYDAFEPIPEQNVIDNLHKKIRYLKELKELAEEGINKARGLGHLHAHNQEAINLSLENLDKIDKEIKEIQSGNNLTELVAFPEILKTMYNKEINKELESKDPKVKLKATAKQSESFYQALKKSYNFMIDYLTDLIEQLESKYREESN